MQTQETLADVERCRRNYFRNKSQTRPVQLRHSAGLRFFIWFLVAFIALAAPVHATHALPASWKETDIGAVGLAGSAAESGGQFVIYASGTDIWGTKDAFHYVYQRLNGNTQIVAKVTSVANTNNWAKAGVMIRESLQPGSRNAFVALTPGNGVTFQSRDATDGLTVNTNVAGIAAPYWVKLARMGNQFSAYRSADGVNWTQIGTTRTINMAQVVHVGLAATSHDNARLGSATFTDVQLLSPLALFVAGTDPLMEIGDIAARKRLESLGYSVIVKSAKAATSADANGKALVVISSTVSPGDVNTKFTNAAVPVLTWENALLDDLGMTQTSSGVDYGTTVNQTEASIFRSACDRDTMYTAAVGYADGCHDISAGLSGTFAVLRMPGTISWGKPGANAIKIAHQSNDPNKALVFAYEKGAAMPRLASAPARRVFLFLNDSLASSVTGRGLSLFDNAVYWATNARYSITKKILHLNYNPTLTTQGMSLASYGGAHWYWHNDPIRLLRDYLADITEASGGYVRWKVVKYADIPETLDRWIPITGPEQFNSATFTEQQYLDAYHYAFTSRDFVGAQKRMPNGGNYGTDYHRILDEFGVDAKVINGEVDEVVVSAFGYAGLWESAMAGSTAYAVNGGVYPRNTPNFVIMGQSYERNLGEALENFGHRTEWLMAFHVFRSSSNETLPYNPCYWPDFPSSCGSRHPTPQRDLWDRFSVVEGNLPGEAGVGAAHFAPNALYIAQDYEWGLTNYVESMSDDWLFNYPKLVGASTKRWVNVNEWIPMAQNFDADRGFKKWWYQHMPRVQGIYRDPTNPANDGKLNNWWEYIVNFNRHPETQN